MNPGATHSFMTRRLAIFLAVTLLWLPQVAHARTLRVLSYNIHHSEGRDGEFDLDRIANIIRAADPDIVALQELDQGNTRSGLDVFQLNQLADLTDMQGFFGKTINYQGGAYGNGVLVSTDFTVPRTINHALPNPGGAEARAALEVRVALDNAEPQVDFTFFATHFDASGGDTNRFAQAGFVNDLVENSTVPSLLAGDLNSRPSSRTIELLLEEWNDATNVSNPGINRASQIDYVMYRLPHQWTVVEKGRFIVNSTTAVASDHYPYLTVLELRSPVADFDGDGEVNGSDLLAWQRGIGNGSSTSEGDANGDGVVNGDDLAIWKMQFTANPPAPPRSFAVPEPPGNFLIGVIAISLLIHPLSSSIAR